MYINNNTLILFYIYTYIYIHIDTPFFLIELKGTYFSLFPLPFVCSAPLRLYKHSATRPIHCCRTVSHHRPSGKLSCQWIPKCLQHRCLWRMYTRLEWRSWWLALPPRCQPPLRPHGSAPFFFLKQLFEYSVVSENGIGRMTRGRVGRSGGIVPITMCNNTSMMSYECHMTWYMTMISAS